jgi:hypothetical protein
MMATTEYNTQHVALTADQVQQWLTSWGNLSSVQSYLATGHPTYGIIVHVQQTADRFDDFLLYIPENPTGVWNPANLHIILVTGNPLVDSVNRAPYVSPDDVGFWQTFQNQLDDALKNAGSFLEWAIIGGLILAVVVYSPQIKSAFK